MGRKGVMRRKVATAVGVHTSNYTKMEKGEREFSIETIDKLAISAFPLMNWYT